MSPERCTSQEEITFLQEFRLDRKSLDRLIKKDKVNTEKFSHQIDRLREELKQEGYEVFTSFDIY